MLSERASFAAKVAKIKQQHESPVYYRPEREAQILRIIVANNDSLLPAQEVARIFRDIMRRRTKERAVKCYFKTSFDAFFKKNIINKIT